MTIIQNPDYTHANKILQKLQANGGYCPCQLEKNEDTHCICKDFRTMIENNQEGYCHCRLYKCVPDNN